MILITVFVKTKYLLYSVIHTGRVVYFEIRNGIGVGKDCAMQSFIEESYRLFVIELMLPVSSLWCQSNTEKIFLCIKKMNGAVKNLFEHANRIEFYRSST